jgi:hypothetical protein
MSQRRLTGLLALTLVVCAQRLVHTKKAFDRPIAVPLLAVTGSTRLKYPSGSDCNVSNGIRGLVFEVADCGRSAILEFAEHNRTASRRQLPIETLPSSGKAQFPSKRRRNPAASYSF